MSAHHKYGPSNYPAWATGCLRFCSNGNSDSKEASEGNKVHEQVSSWIKRGTEPDSAVARWMVKELEKLKEVYEPKEIFSETMVNGKVIGQEIFGTVDAFFVDNLNHLHIIDFKTFSDGTIDYMAQLKGYAALMMMNDNMNKFVQLHVFHGGIFTVETSDILTMLECYSQTEALLREVIGKQESSKPTICKWCQWCDHIKECSMTNKAIQIVSENGVSFNSMSTCQKLVILDVVDKLSKSLREQAKKECEENGGVLEQDGIRYEFKTKAGKGKFNDLTEVASCLCQKTIMATVDNEPKQMAGISQSELLGMCDLSKTKVIDILKEKNKGVKSIKKVDIEKLVESLYTKGEPIKNFVRTK